eukprot:3257012-Pleurochrysis_carterae.AAC.1
MRLAHLSPVQLLLHSLKKVRHAHNISERLVEMNRNARRHESAERRARVRGRQQVRATRRCRRCWRCRRRDVI